VAARICVMIVLAGSLDLMLGHARIVSFAQGLFFGLGAYGVALVTRQTGPLPEALAGGAAAGAAAAAALALGIGLLSRRASAPRIALVTFVLAGTAAALAPHLPALTGGVAGLPVALPDALSADRSHGTLPPVTFGPLAIEDGPLSGRLVLYYLVFGCALALFGAMLRVARAGFVQRLRAQPGGATRGRLALGAIAAVVAALAGALFAIWTGEARPAATLGFDVTLALFVMVLIGGAGTLVGAAIGAVLVVAAGSWIAAPAPRLPPSLADLPVLADLLTPERWPLLLGLALVLTVALLPGGIAGALRGRDRSAPDPAPDLPR